MCAIYLFNFFFFFFFPKTVMFFKMLSHELLQ